MCKFLSHTISNNFKKECKVKLKHLKGLSQFGILLTYSEILQDTANNVAGNRNSQRKMFCTIRSTVFTYILIFLAIKK